MWHAGTLLIIHEALSSHLLMCTHYVLNCRRSVPHILLHRYYGSCHSGHTQAEPYMAFGIKWHVSLMVAGAATYAFIDAIEKRGPGCTYEELLSSMTAALDKLSTPPPDRGGSGHVAQLAGGLLGVRTLLTSHML